MAGKKDEKHIRVALYARQSVSVEEGIDQQLEDCRTFAERRGWTVVEEFRDNDTSASKLRGDETGWGNMLAGFDVGTFDAVVVVAIDRLLRRTVDIVALRDRSRGDVRIVSTREGIDTATPLGKPVLTILVALAEAEIESKKARAIPFRDARHAGGIPTPGRVPYGYRWLPKSERQARGLGERRFEVVETEAAVVRFIFCEALGMLGGHQGIEVGSIVREVNARGWRTRPTTSHPEGGPWGSSTVRRMLLSPYYAAMLPPIYSVANRPLTEGGKPDYWRAERINLDACVPGNWEPIKKSNGEPITIADVRAVRRVLLDARRRTNGGKVSRKWLLSGLARCGAVLGKGSGSAPDESVLVCGARVRSAWTREALRGYRCPHGHFLRRAEVLDNWAVETVLRRLTAPDATTLLRPAPKVDIPTLQSAVQSLDIRRAEVLSLVARGRYTADEAECELNPIDVELARVAAALSEAYRVDPIAEALGAADLRAHWETLTLARRRAVLGALFEPIIHRVGKGWRVVERDARGRQLNVDETAVAAWRRNVESEGGGWEHPLTEDARRAIAAT